MSNRDKAFALFCQDKVPSSPEVKALGITKNTRNTYYVAWKKLGKPDHYPRVKSQYRGEAKEEKKTKLGGGELVGGYKELYQPEIPAEIPKTEPEVSETKPELKPELETSQETEAPVTPSEPEPPVKPKYGDDHNELTAIPEEVIGAGLRIEVTVSLKTLAFFEVAHTIDPRLSLGDFIDDCVVDFFTGRGKDFGLLEVKKEVKT